MFEDFSFFPEAASTVAGRVDAIYLFLVVVTIFFVGLISAALLIFSVRYRRGRGHAPEQVHGSIALEILWSAIPLLIVLFVFGWSAKVFFDVRTVPTEGMEVFVTGKQWMWKLQHPTGHREINSLHVPKGQAVILTMTSEDVIHDFYVPAFRVKQDVVPGMYSQLWFEATKTGTYHLFCAEYCGTKHSQMIGEIVVLEPAAYEAWLAGNPAGRNPVEAGKVLFENLRCATCHAAGSGQRGPDLAGRFGEQVRMRDGQTVIFDENYARQSILEPKSHIVAGFEELMPTYEGQVSEDEILQLIAYIKSLSTGDEESK